MKTFLLGMLLVVGCSKPIVPPVPPVVPPVPPAAVVPFSIQKGSIAVEASVIPGGGATQADMDKAQAKVEMAIETLEK